MCSEPVLLNWGASRRGTRLVKWLSPLPEFVLPQVDEMSKAMHTSYESMKSHFFLWLNQLRPRLGISLLSCNSKCFLNARDYTLGPFISQFNIKINLWGWQNMVLIMSVSVWLVVCVCLCVTEGRGEEEPHEEQTALMWWAVTHMHRSIPVLEHARELHRVSSVKFQPLVNV